MVCEIKDASNYWYALCFLKTLETKGEKVIIKIWQYIQWRKKPDACSLAASCSDVTILIIYRKEEVEEKNVSSVERRIFRKIKTIDP